MRIMREGRGTQFDAAVLDAFMQCFAEDEGFDEEQGNAR